MSKRKRALEDMSGMALSKRLAFNTAAEFQILTGPDIYKNRPRVLDTSNLRSSEIDNFIASEYRLMDVINTMVAQLDGVQGSQQLQKVSQTASYSWQRPIAIDPGYHKIHRKTYGGGRAKVRVDRDRRRVTAGIFLPSSRIEYNQPDLFVCWNIQDDGSWKEERRSMSTVITGSTEPTTIQAVSQLLVKAILRTLVTY